MRLDCVPSGIQLEEIARKPSGQSRLMKADIKSGGTPESDEDEDEAARAMGVGSGRDRGG